jgi:hypothetical protein
VSVAQDVGGVLIGSKLLSLMHGSLIKKIIPKNQ